MNDTNRAWTHEAIRKIEADFARSADTHLVRVDLPKFRYHAVSQG
jgi:cysteine synthase A